MNALRPFSSADVARFGGRSAYIPATWSSASISDDERIWGIPLRCDVRVIWYWKDLLTNPDADVDRAIEKYLKPVVTRLNLSLK